MNHGETLTYYCSCRIPIVFLFHDSASHMISLTREHLAMHGRHLILIEKGEREFVSSITDLVLKDELLWVLACDVIK